MKMPPREKIEKIVENKIALTDSVLALLPGGGESIKSCRGELLQLVHQISGRMLEQEETNQKKSKASKKIIIE